MKCNLKNRNKLITNYLLGELSEEDSKSFEEHYFQCEICFKELKVAENAMKLIEQEGPSFLSAGNLSKQKPDYNVIERFFGLLALKRWGITFAATAVAVLIFIMIFTRNDKEVFTDKVVPEDKETIEQNYETRVQKDDELVDNKIFAELTGPAFKSAPYLEEWITENVRSGNDKIDSVFSPATGEKFHKEDIIFKWKMIDKETVSLKIMNNIEKEIFTLTPGEIQFPIDSIKVNSETFRQSGLYYWRLEDENEVLYVGKFYFLKDDS